MEPVLITLLSFAVFTGLYVLGNLIESCYFCLRYGYTRVV